MTKFTQDKKVEWAKNKMADLEHSLNKFLADAMETKDGMDKLTAHYRISGTYAYSFYNNMLIMLQGGSICGSKANWAKFDRKVTNFKSKTIYVLRPILIDEKINGVKTGDKVCIGYTPSRTWDVSQTSGNKLEYDHNSNEVMDIPYSRVAKVLSKLANAEVKEEATGNDRGYSDGKKLVVSEFSNDVDKTKTLIHETAHHLVHSGEKRKYVSNATREVEAESVAYLVMSYLGLDYELSKIYVASYKSGIKNARCGIMVKTADKMIKALKATMTKEEQFLVALSN